MDRPQGFRIEVNERSAAIIIDGTPQRAGSQAPPEVGGGALEAGAGGIRAADGGGDQRNPSGTWPVPGRGLGGGSSSRRANGSAHRPGSSGGRFAPPGSGSTVDATAGRGDLGPHGGGKRTGFPEPPHCLGPVRPGQGNRAGGGSPGDGGAHGGRDRRLRQANETHRGGEHPVVETRSPGPVAPGGSGEWRLLRRGNDHRGSAEAGLSFRFARSARHAGGLDFAGSQDRDWR